MSVNSSPPTGDEAELFAQLAEATGHVEALSRQLQAAVTGKVHLLPAGIRHAFLTGWNDLCAHLAGWWDFYAEVLANPGSPTRIRAAANAWTTLVGGPVSGRVAFADAGLLETDDTWNGTAADAYRESLPLQKTALQAIKASIADRTSNALDHVAELIYAFWGTVVAALIALAAGLLGALMASGTVFGLPAAPFIAVAAVTAATASLLTGMMLLDHQCQSAATTLQQVLADNTPFPDGLWPPATR
jgi:hypothetical protein